MLTLRAKYRDGQLSFIDPVPLAGEHEILVTFLTSERDPSGLSGDDAQELKALVPQSGLVLSNTELQILRLSQGGARVYDIAKDLGISHGSARNHLSSIYAKLKVRNRAEAIHKSTRLGLLSPVESVFDSPRRPT